MRPIPLLLILSALALPALSQAAVRVEVLQNRLAQPWGMAFLPDDQGILITLRGGELKRWQPGKGLSAPILHVASQHVLRRAHQSHAASVAQRRRLQHRDSPAHLSARVRNEPMGRDLRLSALSKGSVRCGRKLKTKRDQSPDDSVGQGVRQPHLQSLHEYHARGRFAVG